MDPARRADSADLTANEPSGVPFVPWDRGGAEATAFRCGLCGQRFSHGALVCGSCPLHAGCDLVRCPSCGYQFPRRSRILEGAARLLARLGWRVSR